MFIRLRGFAASLVLLFAGLLSAQQPCTLRLSGRVTDLHDGQALSFAILRLEGTERGVLSDSSGYFVFEGLCEGKYTLLCMHIGCDTLRRNIDLRRDQNIELMPEHHKESLWKIDLTDIAPEHKAVQQVSTLSGKELDRLRGLSLAETMKELPGISVLNTGATISKPVIHGLHSNRVLMLNNGIRQEGQQWGNEHAPEIDPFTAGEIRVVKGAAAVRYGSDAMGGVILVQPRAIPDSAGLNGTVNLAGGWNGRSGASGLLLDYKPLRLSALYLRAQGSLRTAGNIHTPAYYLSNTGLREQNFSFAAGYRKFVWGLELYYSQFHAKPGIFSGSHIGNLSDLEKAIHAEVPADSAGFTYTIGRPYQNISHELSKLNGWLRIGSAGKLSLQAARQYNRRQEFDRHRVTGDSSGTLPALQFEITTHTLELLFEHNRFHSFEGSLGCMAMSQKNTWEGQFFIPNYSNRYYGIFWIERLKKEKYEIEGGVRFDSKDMRIYMWENDSLLQPRFLYHNFSGSLGGLYRIDTDISFSANLGSAWRAPGANELYSAGLHHGAAAVEYGNPNLRPEKMLNAAASLHFEKKKWNAEVGAYLNYFGNYIWLVPVQPPVLTVRGAFPAFQFQQTRAVFRGMDVDAAWLFLPWLQLQLKASAVRAHDLNTGQYLVMIPADRGGLHLILSKEKKGPLHDIRFSMGCTGVVRQKRVLTATDYLAPPAGYVLADADLSARIPLKHASLQCGITGSNLLNAAYRDYMDRFRYYANAPGRNYMIRFGFIF